PRAPRAERCAWLLVLTHGVVLAPAPVPFSWGSLQPAATIPSGPAVTIVSAAPGSPWQAGRETGIQTVDRKSAPSVEPVGSTQRESAGDGRAAVGPPASWSTVALSAWLAGIVALLGLGALRYGSFYSQISRAVPAPQSWQAQWRGILEEQGVA